jgi:hypothetical protein
VIWQAENDDFGALKQQARVEWQRGAPFSLIANKGPAMPDVELKTAKFFQQQNEPQEEAEVGDPENCCSAPSVSEGNSSKTASWEKVAAWMGVGAAGVVVVCLALIAVPMVTGIKLPKSASPIDWFLWLGGAKADQTFEKALRDSAARNQQEWDAKYRESPMSQFKGIQPIDINKMQGMQFNGPSQPRR